MKIHFFLLLPFLLLAGVCYLAVMAILYLGLLAIIMVTGNRHTVRIVRRIVGGGKS